MTAPRMKSLLKRLRLWKYIEGPDSIAPVIPEKHELTVIKGMNTSTNEITEIVVDGNISEVDRAEREAKLWFDSDEETRGYLLEAMPEDAACLFTGKESAKSF